MARKGGKRHLKRIAVSKKLKVPRKGFKYIVKPLPGRHKLVESIPLLVVIRDYLKLATTAKEAKKIIKNGEVFVDGEPIKEEKFGVGLFDIIEIPKLKIKKRVVLGNKGVLELSDISEEEVTKKLCMIKNKYYNKGKIMITLHDGRNVEADNSFHVGDSVIFNVKSKKIEKHLPLKENSKCLVLSGKLTGRVVKVKKIISGSATTQKNALVEIENEERVIPTKSLCVIE
ncbi:MAG: S4 domain-containing protein [Candidatus Micrarchaeia archaeon]|jgi:small subunit ribosomal protein S4e